MRKKFNPLEFYLIEGLYKICPSNLTRQNFGCSELNVFLHEKVQVGKDQEKAQSEKDSHSKNRDGKKTKLTIRYLYHENIS